MIYKKIDNNHYVIRIDKEEEVLENLTSLCEKENIKAGSVVGLGAAKHIKIGLYDVGAKKYNSIEMEEPMEITSLVGNISTKEGKTYLHFHINVCNSKMQVFGGHLNFCIIGATCELVLTVLDGEIDRIYDEELGLNLFNL